MSLLRGFLALVAITDVVTCHGETNFTALPSNKTTTASRFADFRDRELFQQAQQIITAYHSGEPKTNHVLRVV